MSLRRDPFHRIRPAEQLRQEKFNMKSPFDLGNSAGWNGSNDRDDVAKVEYLLGRAGELNLAETGGLTGYYGARLEQAVKRYQKRNTLKIDGHLNPKGPAINSLRMQMAAKEDDPADGGKDGNTPDDQTPPSDGDKKPGPEDPPLIREKSGETGDVHMNTEAFAPGTRDKNDFNDIGKLFPRKYWGM